MSEKDLFNKLLKNRPEKEETPVIIGEGRSRKFLVPKWITGLPEDKYVQSVSKFFKNLKIDIPVQIWYDLVVLRLDSIDDRPRCKAPGCTNPVMYEGALYKGRGYYETCCSTCTGSLNRSKYKNTEEMNRKRSLSLLGKEKSESHKKNISLSKLGTTLSESTKSKISESHLGVPLSSSHKSKISSSLRSYIRKNKSYKVLGGSNRNFKKGYIKLAKCPTEFYYMSSYELHIVQLLDSDPDVIRISSCPDRIDYHSDKDHLYLPDILVELSDRFVVLEIKPEDLVENEVVVIKYNAAVDYYSKLPNYEYYMITESDISILESTGSIIEMINSKVQRLSKD